MPSSGSSHTPRKFIRSSMDRLRRSLRNSFRRRGGSGSLNDVHLRNAGGSNSHPTSGDDSSNKPPVWSQDEASVRAGTCSFKVKYLGSVEVYESRGMQVCEEALKVLRNSRRKPVKGILYISGDSLRVVDKDSKGLVVDQTIEKVSFCAPDRQHEKGFAYICRDGTTRRWMCHGFHARKNTGERLSHAVGCAFAVCLEKKQRRDREAQRLLNVQNQQQMVPSVESTKFDSTSLKEKNHNNAAAFQRNSFRYASLQERIQDPQQVIPSEKPPVKPATNPHAVARPRGNTNLFERQGSLRMAIGPDHASIAAPTLKNGTATEDPKFRRFNSLRLNELPSNLARLESPSNALGRSPIAEEDSSPQSSFGINAANYGQQNNPSYVSPPVSELSSPSSGTWSASPFNSAATTNQTNNDPQFLQRMNALNRSRGEEWLKTTTNNAKFWQQYRGVSPPAIATTTNNNEERKSSTASPKDRHQPPPSFPPPPLPPNIVNRTKSLEKNEVTSASPAWTTFDEKLEERNLSVKSDLTVSNNQSSPTNPFTQESSAVKI